MDLDTITFEDALRLLSLPRNIGQYEGVDITVQNGRYGPYMTHGADSRTLTSEDQLFTVSLEEAIEIYKQPKVRRGRGTPKPPLKELGPDPATGRELIIKDGRFGMYITDGETNATLRRGDTVEFMTIERGLELLAGRRAWEAENGPSPKKTKKAASKKTAAAKKAELIKSVTPKNVIKKGTRKKAAKKKAKV
jgi:DNA topoisomerase-1